MNQYKGFNSKTYQTKPLEIFKFLRPTASDAVESSEEWCVSGVESDSYPIYRGTPKSEEALLKQAEKVIRQKYDFIGEIEFVIVR